MKQTLIITLFSLFVLSVLFFTKLAIFVVPPSDIKALSLPSINKQMITIIDKKENNIIESPDSICLKLQITSDYLCKKAILEEHIERESFLMELPYYSFAYDLSLIFYDENNINKKKPSAEIFQKRDLLLEGAQKLKTTILLAKLDGNFIYKLEDLKNGYLEKKYLQRLPTYLTYDFQYHSGPILMFEGLEIPVCFSLEEIGGGIIYSSDKMINYKFGCYIKNHKPIFFYQ